MMDNRERIQNRLDEAKASREANSHDTNMHDRNYNTRLNPTDEKGFQHWKAENAPQDSGEDYDLRGAYKGGEHKEANGHWSDKYKKPNHPTFSDQSQYAKEAPEKAGHWNGDNFIPPKRKR